MTASIPPLLHILSSLCDTAQQQVPWDICLQSYPRYVPFTVCTPVFQYYAIENPVVAAPPICSWSRETSWPLIFFAEADNGNNSLTSTTEVFCHHRVTFFLDDYTFPFLSLTVKETILLVKAKTIKLVYGQLYCHLQMEINPNQEMLYEMMCPSHPDENTLPLCELSLVDSYF